MTIAAYQTLYESSVAFGMRKALMAEQGKADMEKKVGLWSFRKLKSRSKYLCNLLSRSKNLKKTSVTWSDKSMSW
jgi:hypothetical protein